MFFLIAVVTATEWVNPLVGLQGPKSSHELMPSYNDLVTKMVANSGTRVGIERNGSARVADFRNTNQHFEGQNETGRNGHQQILSQARLPIPPQGQAGGI